MAPSRVGYLVICDCTDCKGTKSFSANTVRRHMSLRPPNLTHRRRLRPNPPSVRQPGPQARVEGMDIKQEHGGGGGEKSDQEMLDARPKQHGRERSQRRRSIRFDLEADVDFDVEGASQQDELEEDESREGSTAELEERREIGMLGFGRDHQENDSSSPSDESENEEMKRTPSGGGKVRMRIRQIVADQEQGPSQELRDQLELRAGA